MSYVLRTPGSRKMLRLPGVRTVRIAHCCIGHEHDASLNVCTARAKSVVPEAVEMRKKRYFCSMDTFQK